MASALISELENRHAVSVSANAWNHLQMGLQPLSMPPSTPVGGLHLFRRYIMYRLYRFHLLQLYVYQRQHSIHCTNYNSTLTSNCICVTRLKTLTRSSYSDGNTFKSIWHCGIKSYGLAPLFTVFDLLSPVPSTSTSCRQPRMKLLHAPSQAWRNPWQLP